MKISELINILSDIKYIHGDLRCITPGDEEQGWDDVLVSVQENKKIRDYDEFEHDKFEFEEDDVDAEYLVINFE